MAGGLLVQRRKPEEELLHQAVREGWPKVLAVAEERGGLPKRVKEEVRRYLACGDVRRGLTLVKCEACADVVVIAFSCKSRGWCPSCAARRTHETAAHLDDVLPRVAYRQWTMTVPYAMRWAVLKEPKLLRGLERCLAKAIFRWQRQQAKRLGVDGKPRSGAVGLTQLFNSQLGAQPHSHLLVAEGVWVGADFVPLPPPDQEELEAVLKRLLKQAQRLFESLETPWPEDAFDMLQLQGAQLRLHLPREESPRPGRLVAMGGGFSLHAGTWVHANDRAGLLRLARYGARGPIAGSRLSRREDGTYEYETKHGVALVLTAEELTRRLISLIPPRGLHLTNFFGVFSSHSTARAKVVPPPLPPAPKEETAGQQLLPGLCSPVMARRPRLDWASLHARTWGCDTWQCPCGGRRRVVAVVTGRRAAEELLRKLGRLPPPEPLLGLRERAPPQLELTL